MVNDYDREERELRRRLASLDLNPKKTHIVEEEPPEVGLLDESGAQGSKVEKKGNNTTLNEPDIVKDEGKDSLIEAKHVEKENLSMSGEEDISRNNELNRNTNNDKENKKLNQNNDRTDEKLRNIADTLEVSESEYYENENKLPGEGLGNVLKKDEDVISEGDKEVKSVNIDNKKGSIKKINRKIGKVTKSKKIKDKKDYKKIRIKDNVSSKEKRHEKKRVESPKKRFIKASHILKVIDLLENDFDRTNEMLRKIPLDQLSKKLSKKEYERAIRIHDGSFKKPKRKELLKSDYLDEYYDLLKKTPLEDISEILFAQDYKKALKLHKGEKLDYHLEYDIKKKRVKNIGTKDKNEKRENNGLVDKSNNNTKKKKLKKKKSSNDDSFEEIKNPLEDFDPTKLPDPFKEFQLDEDVSKDEDFDDENDSLGIEINDFQEEYPDVFKEEDKDNDGLPEGLKKLEEDYDLPEDPIVDVVNLSGEIKKDNEKDMDKKNEHDGPIEIKISPKSRSTAEEVKFCADSIIKMRKEMGKILIGQDEIVTNLIMGLLCNAHILVEGVPGIAKTLAIRALAMVSGCSVKRIQFTVDMLPTDIIGLTSYNPQTKTFEVIKGPIFANFLIADEINRSPPKTQSALIEAMQEKQVTIGRENYPLPAPFFVMATENPIENAGVYPLPEAQIDRFLFKLVMGYPEEDEELKVMESNMSTKKFETFNIKSVITPEKIVEMQDIVQKVYLDENIKKYILAIVRKTRNKDFEGSEYITYGSSPRASIALYIASKARAIMEGRNYVLPEDVRKVVFNVLRHRLILSYKATIKKISEDSIIQTILDSIIVE